MRSREKRGSLCTGKAATKALWPAPSYIVHSGKSWDGPGPGKQSLGNPAPVPVGAVAGNSVRPFVVDTSRCAMHGIQYGRVPIGVVFPQESIFESSAAARSAITFGCACSRRRRMKASGVSNRSPRACTRVVVWRTALKEDTRTCSGAWRQFCGIRMFSGARHECRTKGEQRMASPLDRHVMVAIGCSGGDKGSRKIFREAVMRAARRRSEGCSAMRNFSRKIR